METLMAVSGTALLSLFCFSFALLIGSISIAAILRVLAGRLGARERQIGS